MHPFSLAPSQVTRDAANSLYADAVRLLPPVFAEAVGAEPRPFALRDAFTHHDDPATALAAYERERFQINRAMVNYGVRLGSALK